jgi:hypothetical protein
MPRRLRELSGLGVLLVLAGCAGGGRALRLPPPDAPALPAPSPWQVADVVPPDAVPLAEPDRTASPWSQTPFTVLAEGAVEEKRTAGGRHLRIGTARGSVHVWFPPGYAAPTAGIAIYVHGYYTNVDQAVVDHDLIGQFRASRRNAVFIVPEAPAWNGEAVWWTDLGELLEEVQLRARFPLPRGPVVVAGHSGAIRTVLAWLDHPRLRELLLMDALYRGEDALAAWLEAEPERHRVILVGQETGPRTESWLAERGASVVLLPQVPAAIAPRDRAARVMYLRSQYDHMGLVTTGRVLPLLLGVTGLPPGR